MTYDFESLSCPMCGGELIYSEGTHDLCCAKNKYELSSMEMGRGRSGEVSGDRGERFRAMPGDKLEKIGRALHEPRAGYGSNGETQGELSTPLSTAQVEEKSKDPLSESAEEGQVGVNECRMSKSDLEKTSGCLFAVSFTESGRHGTLWSIRTVHWGTNYFSLMRLMDKIEKRQRRGEPLAANVPNLPRKVERSKECKLAFRYSLEVEDLYSIKYSSETVDKLAMYYGLTEPDIRHIQAAEIGGDQGT